MAWIEKVVGLFAAIDFAPVGVRVEGLQELRRRRSGRRCPSRVQGTPTAAMKHGTLAGARAWDRLIVAENRAIVVMISVPPAPIPRVPLCS